MDIPESANHFEDDITYRCDEAWTHTHPIHNQNFVVMSIVEAPKDETSAVKIFGVFSSLKEANTVSQEISKENDFFNVYVASTNVWVPVPPTVELVENIEYQEKRLTEIKNSYAAGKERDAKNLLDAVKRDNAIKQEEKSKGIEESKDS